MSAGPDSAKDAGGSGKKRASFSAAAKVASRLSQVRQDDDALHRAAGLLLDAACSHPAHPCGGAAQGTQNLESCPTCLATSCPPVMTLRVRL